jgi:predicted DCC family thiol-disulfide oxidoreductase YuxK
MSESQTGPSLGALRFTGAQYSLFRFVSAVVIAIELTPMAWPWGTALFSVSLAAGLFPRMSAAVLCLPVAIGFPSTAQVIGWCALLFVHIAAQPDPYGSVERRGRSDPGADWWIPAGIPICALLFAMAVGAWQPALLLLIYVLTAFVPAQARDARELVFYDGHCGLCHNVLRFAISEDPGGSRFRYAPLDSDALRSRVSPEQQRNLPDSVAVLTSDGRLLSKSRAVLHILSRLGGVWRVFSFVGMALPQRLLDAGYDFIARIRHKLFTRPADACPLLPAPLRGRFDY